MSELTTTLLDTKSSSIHKTLKPTYRATLLQHCEDAILQAEYIYAKFDFDDQTEKLERLQSCRSGACFYRNKDTGTVRIGSTSCHLRFCPICAKGKTSIIQKNVKEWIKTIRFPKMLTFTLKHSDKNLTEQINRLYDSFRIIRRSGVMKKLCKSGIWFFQVKKSKSDHLWHPHLHCLVAGSYIPQKKLSLQWLKATGDSKIVDIRLIKDIEVAANYVSRYAAQPCNIKYLTLDESVEMARSLTSRRICGTWGSCRKMKITSMPKIDTSGWTKIGSWYAVIANKENDKSAKKILRAWLTNTPLEKGVNIDHLFANFETNSTLEARSSPEIEAQIYFDWSRNKCNA